MSEQQLEDPLLLAVRQARPAIDEAALTPTSQDAVKVLERVLSGAGVSVGAKASSGQRGVRRERRGVMPRFSGARIGVLATAAAAAVAAIVIALIGVSGAPSLVDRAYAAINAGEQVLHEVDIAELPGLPGFYDRVEGWLLPADGQARLIEISGYRRSGAANINEWLITATGRVFTRSCLSGCRSADTGSFINGNSAWSSEGHAAAGTFGGPTGDLPGTYARWFRAAYRAHAIVPDGDSTFAGRRVARFESMVTGSGTRVVAWRPGTPPPANGRHDRAFDVLVDWYIDPATASPVGFETFGCASQQVGSCHVPGRVVRIATFQRLDPTPENAAQLTGPGAPPGAR